MFGTHNLLLLYDLIEDRYFADKLRFIASVSLGDVFLNSRIKNIWKYNVFKIEEIVLFF